MKLMALQEALLGLEVDAVEVVAGLVTEFDRCYSEMAEANKLQYNAYFTQVREGGGAVCGLACGLKQVKVDYCLERVLSCHQRRNLHATQHTPATTS